MKKFLSILLGIIFCFSFTGCDLSFDGDKGEIVTNLTQLPAPEIKGVTDDYVHWDEIPNASSYIIKINSYQESTGNALKYSISSVIDNYIEPNIPTELHIYVKAKGNQILYSDSEWSNEYVCTYTKGGNASNITQLATPEITSYDGISIYWTNIANVDKYYVKVNGTEYTTYENYYTVSFTQNETFTFTVKAVSNHSDYEESEWAEVRSFEYIKGQTGGTFLQTGIGYTVDVVSAKNYSEYKKGVSVLDRSKLSNASFDQNYVNYNDVKTVSSHSISDLVSKSSVTTEIEVGNKAKKKTMFCNIEVGLKSSASFDYSKYSDKYYYTLDHYIERYTLSLVDFAVEGAYTSYLSDGYLFALQNLYENQNEENFYKFFDTYGTHLIGSGVFGGRLNTYFSAVTNKTTIDESMATSLSTQVDFGISAVNNTSVGVKADIASALNISTSDIETSFSAVAYGGNAFGASSIDDFNNNYKTWWDSFNNGTANAVLVNYSPDGLIALWELLPAQYASMMGTMEEAFVQYYNNSYNGVIDSFKFNDTVNYAGGAGTQADPYLISNINHMINIEKNMTSCFKLIDDVDLSDMANWEPIGGYYMEDGTFTGTLDGNGYQIKSLTRTSNIPEKNNRSYFGLFSCIGVNGIVKDLIFKDVYVKVSGPANNNSSMRAFFGVVAGKCMGKVSNVELNGSYTYTCCTNGETWLGGICGYAVNATISYCKNNINLKADRYSCAVGGFVAYSEGGIIEYCENMGNITAVGTDWGGFAYAGCIGAETHKTNPTKLVGNQNSGKASAKAYDSSSLFTNCSCKTGTTSFASKNDVKF